MRNTYKKVIIIKSAVTVYDTVKKVEEVIATEYPEGHKPTLPDNCVLISETEVERQEVTMKLSPENFIKYAEVVTEEV